MKSDRKAVLARLTKRYTVVYGKADNLRFFTAPGRTELGGNHTDHNNGRVLAAAIDLEAAAVACSTAGPGAGTIELRSAGWEQPFLVELSDLRPVRAEEGTTQALIRGVAEGFAKRGLKVGGFRACVESSVLQGSGLSSSAAFEVLTGSILNALYNGGAIDAVTLAVVGQEAENLHFGKPCGLMDQMASSVGGLVTIDFRDPPKPVIERLDLDWEALGYALCIVDTKGSHADLTPDYAAIRSEMNQVAQCFGKVVLREVDPALFWSGLAGLRSRVGDRAVLRAIHFFEENRRVEAMVTAIKANDFDQYLALVNASGTSSAEFLQNVVAHGAIKDQAVPLGLALTRRFLSQSSPAGVGASRVHGGGFAGTIQAYVPLSAAGEYAKTMEAVFGPGSVHTLSVRPERAGETNV
jgi:galactokinase